MESRRHIPRILRYVFFIITFMIVVAAGCTVWAGNCAEPKDLQFSTESGTRIRQILNNPGSFTWMLYDEISRLLRRYGNSSLYMMHFGESCDVAGCSIDYISMIVEVAHRPICSWADNNFNHSFVSVKYRTSLRLNPRSQLMIFAGDTAAIRHILLDLPPKSTGYATALGRRWATPIGSAIRR